MSSAISEKLPSLFRRGTSFASWYVIFVAPGERVRALTVPTAKQDIWNEKLFVVDLAKGPASLKEFHTNKAFGVTADIEGSETDIVAAAKDGFVKFDLTTGKQEYLAKLWSENDKPDNNHM